MLLRYVSWVLIILPSIYVLPNLIRGQGARSRSNQHIAEAPRHTPTPKDDDAATGLAMQCGCAYDVHPARSSASSLTRG